MNPKQLKKLKKQVKKAHQVVKKQPYIEQLMTYRDLFDDFPQIKFLINNVLESDRLIKNGLLPQPLPKLLLPDNIQDIIFKKVNEQYPQGNPEGDRLWNRYVDALPKLDRLLRNYRDYLEATYGMWSYVNAPYIKALSEYLHGRPTLEIMAGNGYISSGLRICGQPRRSLPPTVPTGSQKTRPASIPSPRLNLWMPWPQLKSMAVRLITSLCHGRPTSWKLIGKSCSCCVKTIQKSNCWSLVRKTVLLIQLNSGKMLI